jgi:phage shock protein PspC (stress-responsive transcriptional regulator)
MPADTTPLPFRHDTLLGVCEGLGRTTGVNPTIFRIVFAALLLWNPEIVVAVYLALGAVLLLVHWLVSDVRALGDRQTTEAANSDEEDRLAA